MANNNRSIPVTARGLHATPPEAMVTLPSIQISLCQLVPHVLAPVRSRNATVFQDPPVRCERAAEAGLPWGIICQPVLQKSWQVL